MQSKGKQTKEQIKIRQLKFPIDDTCQELLYLQQIHNSIIKVYKESIVILQFKQDVNCQIIYIYKQSLEQEIKRVLFDHQVSYESISIEKMYRQHEQLCLIIKLDDSYALATMVEEQGQIKELKNIFKKEAKMFSSRQQVQSLLKEELLASKIQGEKISIINYCPQEGVVKYYTLRMNKTIDIKVQTTYKIQKPRLHALFSQKNAKNFMLIDEKNMLIFSLKENIPFKQGNKNYDYLPQDIFKATIDHYTQQSRKRYKLQLLSLNRSKKYIFFLFNKLNEMGHHQGCTLFVFEKHQENDCKIKDFCHKEIKILVKDVKRLKMGLLYEDENSTDIWIKNQDEHYIVRIIDNKKQIIYQFLTEETQGILAQFNGAVLMIGKAKQYQIQLPKVQIKESSLKSSPSFSQKMFIQSSPQSPSPNTPQNKQMKIVNSKIPYYVQPKRSQTNPFVILQNHQKQALQRENLQNQIERKKQSFLIHQSNMNRPVFNDNSRQFKTPDVRDASSEEEYDSQCPNTQNLTPIKQKHFTIPMNAGKNIIQMQNYQVSSNKFSSGPSFSASEPGHVLESNNYQQNLIMGMLSNNIPQLIASKDNQEEKLQVPLTMGRDFSFGKQQLNSRQAPIKSMQHLDISSPLEAVQIVTYKLKEQELPSIIEHPLQESRQTKVEQLLSLESSSAYSPSRIKITKLEPLYDFLDSLQQLKDKTSQMKEECLQHKKKQEYELKQINKNIPQTLNKQYSLQETQNHILPGHAYSEPQLEKIIWKEIILYYFDKKKPLKKVHNQKKNHLQLLRMKINDHKQNLQEMKEQLIQDRRQIDQLTNQYKNLLVQKQKPSKEKEALQLKNKNKFDKVYKDIMFNVKYGKPLQIKFQEDDVQSPPFIDLKWM